LRYKLLSEIYTHNQDCNKESQGFHAQPVFEKETAEEASDELVDALEPVLSHDHLPVIVKPVYSKRIRIMIVFVTAYAWSEVIIRITCMRPTKFYSFGFFAIMTIK
jgi:hypothetical protein